ncbi:hypothetical protein P7C70_g231, partial [Phenoliferia sp. Uapishka_3]
MAFIKLAIIAAAASIANAAVVPLTPNTANVGAECLIKYTPDTTGTWTNATVLLRSGPNLAMTTVTPVLEGLLLAGRQDILHLQRGCRGWDYLGNAHITYSFLLHSDATTGGEIVWTCPDVTPNAAIYFYEFNIDGTNNTWTTRFTIASSTGATTTPTNSTTTSGTTVAWGNGVLAPDATVSTASVSGVTSGATSTATSASSSATSSDVIVVETELAASTSGSAISETSSSSALNSEATTASNVVSSASNLVASSLALGLASVGLVYLA